MTALDVAIVGAGPAGCWAARELALSGARVRLFDHTHPREKPCGGGLTARALVYLERAGLRARLPGVAIRSARFQSGPLTSPVSVAVPMPMGAAPPLVVFSRRDLDGALLQLAVDAGVSHVAERVLDVEAGTRGAMIRTPVGSHRASFVIGADGANSIVRRRLFRPFSRNQVSLAAGHYARRAASPEVVIQCLAEPPGYLWSFPRADHLAIGVCTPATNAAGQPLQALALEWSRRSGFLDGTAIHRYGWPIPSLGAEDFDAEHPSGPRWMLVGDAAGLVDPLTREGIYYAMRSGELAAGAVADERDAAASYGTRLRDEIHPELRRAGMLTARFFTSSFADLLVEALERSPAVRAIMVDLIAGRQPYATLRRRLLGTLEIGLAWRLMRLQSRSLAGLER